MRRLYVDTDGMAHALALNERIWTWPGENQPGGLWATFTVLYCKRLDTSRSQAQMGASAMHCRFLLHIILSALQDLPL